MIKYARIADEKAGTVNVGLGTNTAFYKSIGMTEMDVEQGYDGQWYLKGYAPAKVATHKELIDFVTAEADKVAYGGITIIANGQEYLFKTTTDNITRCNSVLAMYGALPDDTVIPWEVWQGDFPVMLPVNKLQFQQGFAFGGQMIIEVETVKGNLNMNVQTFTDEQLADPDFIAAFKENAVRQLAGVNTVFSLDPAETE